MKDCTHINQIKAGVEPKTPGACEDCQKLGESWVHLRMCLTCGHVGCCNNSKNKHAQKHFEATKHPIIQSAQPNESWRYCFIDDVYI